MGADVVPLSARTTVRALVVSLTLAIVLGLIGGSTVARAGTGGRKAAAHSAVAAPCASQGSCQYCGSGGVGTGNCTRAKLEYNVAWCGRNRHHLGAYNTGKCKAEARFLSWGPGDQLLPWVNVICGPPNARTIYMVVKGIAEKTGPVGVACAGIGLYAALHSLLVEIL